MAEQDLPSQDCDVEHVTSADRAASAAAQDLGMEAQGMKGRKASERSRSTYNDGKSGGKWDKESYKQKKESYRREVKKVHKDAKGTLADPAVTILSGWLKIRGTLKNWFKLWCVVKPGLVLIYKNDKQDVWIGTLMLSACEVIERPSKKEGFCFKIFHPINQSIWAGKGPRGELTSTSAVVHPMPRQYLILRAGSEAEGKCWLDGLEVAVSMSLTGGLHASLSSSAIGSPELTPEPSPLRRTPSQSKEQWNEHAFHYRTDQFPQPETDLQEEGTPAMLEEEGQISTDEEIEAMPQDRDQPSPEPEPVIETNYVSCSSDELGQSLLTGELEENNKSLLWTILKQVRPGMDLSRVVLPTFILEPRSFLDKLSDYYYHGDFLSRAAKMDDALERMKQVIRWYLSGFYKKPKGLKKPYNPIIGEWFRCMWPHQDSNSRTFFVSEQVSHHPPVSAFYVSNRKDGFCVNGSILCKSKFYGNSTQIILDGTATLIFLERGEEYTMNFPYVNCKGILIPPIVLELGGKVNIQCEKTGYRTDLEFKLKPFWRSSDHLNVVSGKIKMGKESILTFDGHWDGEVWLADKKASISKPELLWNPDQFVRASRLKRNLIDPNSQLEFESERLWQKVTEAISNEDQEGATSEKAVLEDRQRQEEKQRKATGQEWVPRLFERGPDGRWVYIHRDLRPWDAHNDMFEYDVNGVMKTKTRCIVGPLRAPSIINIPVGVERLSVASRQSQQQGIEEVLGLKDESLPAGRQLVKEVEKCTEHIIRLVEIEEKNSEKLSAIVSHLQRDRSSEHGASRLVVQVIMFLIIPIVLAYFLSVWLQR